MSALADGEATMAELDALLGLDADEIDLHGRWHRYQVAGEVLRGAEGESLRSPNAFLAGVMAGLPEDGVRPSVLQVAPAGPRRRAQAANDSVVRWKWLAVAASVSAVMAVSWGVLRSTPGAVEGLPSATPQLASAEPRVQVPVVPSEPVVVKTEQGNLIRDARLEQLLADHRHFGGASALQMPAGFLRNATYEATPQR
ncbi:MAG: sigma-E factor negative regulatory protein [Burkholderiaceae bacterium]